VVLDLDRSATPGAKAPFLRYLIERPKAEAFGYLDAKAMTEADSWSSTFHRDRTTKKRTGKSNRRSFGFAQDDRFFSGRFSLRDLSLGRNALGRV
jgi:hypothetical protein